MMQVAYSIMLGSNVLDNKKHAGLRRIEINAAMAVPVNYCSVVLDSITNISTKAGDTITVKLGDSNSQSLVFSGTVTSVAISLNTVEIEAMSNFTRLLNHFDNAVHEQSTAGDIVQALLSSQEVSSGEIEAGNSYESYRIAHRTNLWQACQQLATYNGFDFYATHEDKAVFKTYQASSAHDICYGKNLLSICVTERKSDETGVEVNGESPVGQGESSDASSWLTKKDVQGSAGSSKQSRRYQIPVATTKELASNIAEALFNSSQTFIYGHATSIGIAAAKLGDALNFTDIPDNNMNGQVKIVALHHQLDQQHGYITQFKWEKAA